MLYKVKGNKIEIVKTTHFDETEKMEKDLEDWIEATPSILGEKLLIIGRQVQIPEVNDKIDLLAIDVNGNLVIIELKRGKLKHPIDMQALRYASYVSRWGYDDIENQAQSYYLEKGEKDFNFNEKLENFFAEAGLDEVPDLNSDQRIILVGSKIKDKLGSVALWLREHNVDIKVIEISLFRDKEDIYLTSNVIIPPPTTEKFEIGKLLTRKDRPWLANGEEWHLEKRCGKDMREKLLALINLIKENKTFKTVEGPSWNQKVYISFKEENHNWMAIRTHKTTLILDIFVKRDDFKAEEVAKLLGIRIFDRDFSLSEKLQLESSVEIINKGDYDKIRVRIKKEFDVNSENFRHFLEKCYFSFKKVK